MPVIVLKLPPVLMPATPELPVILIVTSFLLGVDVSNYYWSFFFIVLWTLTVAEGFLLLVRPELGVLLYYKQPMPELPLRIPAEEYSLFIKSIVPLSVDGIIET